MSKQIQKIILKKLMLSLKRFKEESSNSGTWVSLGLWTEAKE